MVSGAVRRCAVLLPRLCLAETPKSPPTVPRAQLAVPGNSKKRQSQMVPGMRPFHRSGLSPSWPSVASNTSKTSLGRCSVTPRMVIAASLSQAGSARGGFSLPLVTLRPFSQTKTTVFSEPRTLQTSPETSTDSTTASLSSARDSTNSQYHLDRHGFAKSEKAAKAAHVNLRARLSKDGQSQSKTGFGEVWRLLKIAMPEAKWLSIAFTFLLVSSSVTMTIPLSVGRVLDLATNPAEDARLLGLTQTQFFGAFASLLTLGALANFSRVILLRIIGERVVARLRSQLYRRTYVQDAEFFDANRVGDLISRLSSDTIIVGKGITQNLSDGLRAMVSGAGGLVAMAWISPKLCGTLLLMFPPVAIGAFFYGRAIRNFSRRIQKALGNLTRIAEERLGNIKTSQAFAGEVQEVARYNAQIRKVFWLGRKESLITATFFGSTGWAGNMTILALLASGGSLVKSGAISLGDLTSFMMYTAFAGSSLFGVSGFYTELMRSAGAASRLFELQDRRPIIPQTVGIKVKSAQGTIRFSQVRFAYPTRPAVTIFSGLDFEIPSGSNVCIVGPSGSGKSTVAGLILRFYNPTSGKITIGDVDISTMNIKSLRRRIGVVSQEPVLFSGTIAENIAYGKPNTSRAEIVAAARKANCQFISDFPDGLETQVGARGAQLSGGQKQRIAIARALVKDPDILILDEATSALDAESETLVNSAMAALMKGRSTTISIAHRLSTIKRSDIIVVLSIEGTVAEVGTYAELSADKQSAFSKLMEWQMTGGEAMMERHHHGGAVDSHITEREEIEEDLEEEEEQEEQQQEEEGEEEEEEEEEEEKRERESIAEDGKKSKGTGEGNAEARSQGGIESGTAGPRTAEKRS